MSEKWKAIIVPVMQAGGHRLSSKVLSEAITANLNSLAQEDRAVLRPVHLGDNGVLLMGQLEEYEDDGAYGDLDRGLEAIVDEPTTPAPVQMKSRHSLLVLEEAVSIATRVKEEQEAEAVHTFLFTYLGTWDLPQLEVVLEDCRTLMTAGSVSDEVFRRVLCLVTERLEQNIKMSLS